MPFEKPHKGKIIVAGILFWFPLAGVTYQFLHYLIGLRRLGYDPYYVEDSGRWVYDPRSNDLVSDASANIAAIAPILAAYGFADRWAFRGHYPGGRCYGMTEARILQLYREADALLNVTGAQELRDEHMACPRRIYVETDPVASQIAVALQDPETIATLTAHDTHFTFGENLGAPDCGAPVERFHWLPTRQPVVLDLWDNPVGVVPNGAYNTIASWSNKGKDITYRGETYYWSKEREFMKIIDLPRRYRAAPFELATGVDEEIKRRLDANGWRYVEALQVSSSLDRYRAYIQRARGEFTVAKDQYVRLRSGWFSDRSVCYLAAGRPVVTQDTGFGKVLPTGKGLYAWTTPEEIMAAIDRIERDYEGNCRAAREIAEQYFAADKVLASLMTRAGL